MYAGDKGSVVLHMGTHVHADAVRHANTAIALVPLYAAGGSWVEAHFVVRQPLPRDKTARQDALRKITRAKEAVTPWFMLVPCACEDGKSVWTCPNEHCTDKQYTGGRIFGNENGEDKRKR